MFMTKLTRVALVLLIVGALGTGAGLVIFQAHAQEETEAKQPKVVEIKAKPKTDKEQLQGTWVAVKMEKDGQQAPDAAVKKMAYKISINEDKVLLQVGTDDECEFSFKLDPKMKLKHLDASYTKGPRKGETFPGIYSLEDGVLKWCWDLDGKTRPTAFVTKPMSGQTMLTLKRETAQDDKKKDRK